MNNINVEVVYAVPDRQIIRTVNVNAGARIEVAIELSGIMMDFPEIDLTSANTKVGIFGKLAALSTTLNEGDRVEIYRPLIADPKEVRRKRAAEGKKMKKGG